MTVITVRAATSQKAMEEILRRLGPDALILSTRKIDGQYELRASGEGDDLDPPDTEAAASPIPPARPALRATRSPQHPAQGAASFERSFQAATLAPRKAAPRKAAPDDPHADLARRLFFPEGLVEPVAPRTVIIGPPGSGKSMVAARLAARILQADRRLQPRLIAPAPGLLLHEDRLRGWARLMGLRLDRPTIHDALLSAEADPAFPEIFDLSDAADHTPDLAARLIDSDDAELLLCIPAGTHPALTARLCRDWAAYQPTVCLTRLDLWEPEIPELEAIADAGLKLSHVSAGTGLIDTLRRPVPADLHHWSGAWAVQQGIAAE
ncbi:hypothetical protein [Paragemmobacter straminiformis]|uniref:Flagella-associated GTP-binding protein n=1 Tax=Paragemmobacter straminiformis TaxID=2045119 RepID=A0A842I5C7_9RHOB|nr:hypothetical protein [Gemmobacter straminiformis]MBC2834805.1 hypothetical protein [Gemmobacter straminiformis]